MAERKIDLEEEMSRFEQEISGHLPPPPKMPKMTESPKHQHPVPSQNGLSPAPKQKGEFALPPRPRPPFPNMPMPPMPPGLRMPPMGSMRPPVPHLRDMPRPPGMGDMPRPPMMSDLHAQLLNSLPPPPIPPQMPMPPMPPMMVPGPVPPMMPIVPPVSNSSMINTAPVIKPPTVPLDNYEPASSVPVETTADETTEDVGEESKKTGKGKKKALRVAGGQVWEDSSLLDWDPNDFRLFVGDIGNEVTDDTLLRAFNRYPSLQRVKVVRDKKTKKTKGFGFISFKDPQDYLKAMREMNGKYVGNRPIKLRKSTWRERDLGVARRKEKEKKKLGLR